MTEAHIVINGIELSNAQSMAVRVAICDFTEGLSDPDRYGRDDDAAINDAYRQRLTEVMKIMLI